MISRPDRRLGRAVRHRHRGDRTHPAPAEGARPMLIGFDSSEAAGQCVAAIIGSGIIPVAIEFMDRPAIRVCEAFAKAGYPDVEALLIVEVEGSDAEIKALLETITALARPSIRASCASARAPSKAPPSGRAASRPSAPSAASPITTAWTARSRSANWPTCWSKSRAFATRTASRLPISSTPAMATCIR